MRLPLYLSVFVLLVFQSCTKDTIEPVIEIITPQAGSDYGIDDPIKITAKVRDNSNIEYIEVQLVDEDLLSAQAQKRIDVGSQSYDLDFSYTITNEEIETGVHYLRISAFDGVNTQNDYIEIQVDGTPLKRLGFIITSKPSSDQVEIGEINLQGNYTQMTVYNNRDHIGSVVNSKYQSVQIIGEYTGDFVSINTVNNSEDWNIPIIGGGTPYFTSINHYEGLTYVGHYDGQLKGYNENGSVEMFANGSDNFYFVNCFLHNGFIISQENDINSSAKRLTTYYSTGFEYQWDGLSIDIEDYGSISNDEIILFGNENGQGKILVYSMSGGSFWEPKSVPFGEIFSTEQIDDDTFIIGHESGLLVYNYSQSSISTFSTETNIESMYYDELYEQLIIADFNAVKVFDYPSTNPAILYSHTSEISEVHVLNNR